MTDKPIELQAFTIGDLEKRIDEQRRLDAEVGPRDPRHSTMIEDLGDGYVTLYWGGYACHIDRTSAETPEEILRWVEHQPARSQAHLGDVVDAPPRRHSPPSPRGRMDVDRHVRAVRASRARRARAGDPRVLAARGAAPTEGDSMTFDWIDYFVGFMSGWFMRWYVMRVKR